MTQEETNSRLLNDEELSQAINADRLSCANGMADAWQAALTAQDKKTLADLAGKGGLEVLVCSYEDLTPEQRDEQPNNGSGKEYASYLVVKIGGEILEIESDAMEPEDASFHRDLSWVKPLLEAIGLAHAAALALKDELVAVLKKKLENAIAEIADGQVYLRASTESIATLHTRIEQLEAALLTDTEVSAINFAVKYFEQAAYGESKLCTFKPKLEAQANLKLQSVGQANKEGK